MEMNEFIKVNYKLQSLNEKYINKYNVKDVDLKWNYCVINMKKEKYKKSKRYYMPRDECIKTFKLENL
jgi:hypothetical protein